MKHHLALPLLALGGLLSACAGSAPPLGPDGQPVQGAYRVSQREEGAIQIRMLDAVNSLRRARGLSPLRLNAALNAAAATHSRDMSVQNRPWHFGSDGSSPIDRVRRAGYDGRLSGENISESYETELETLAAWMQNDNTKGVILDERATDLGFAFFQEPNGKLWWTLVTGRPPKAQPDQQSAAST